MTKVFHVMTRALSLAIALLACSWLASSLAQEHAEKSTDTPAATAAAGHSEPAAAHTEAGAGHADHAAGGHHDDTDLSHGNASANLHSPADFRFDMSIYSFIVFLILLAVLYKFAWGPIAIALQRREETIARQINEARLASEKGALLLREYDARLAAATDEARHIVSDARKNAEIAKDRIVAEARDVAQKERERAVTDIGVAKNQALDEIAKKSVQSAVSLASQLLRREVRPQEHEALIGEAINKFQNVN